MISVVCVEDDFEEQANGVRQLRRAASWLVNRHCIAVKVAGNARDGNGTQAIIGSAGASGGASPNSQLCYSASMRPGRTKTTSFSLDPATLKQLKALAGRRHKGNVSALLAEIAAREAKFAAAEIYFEKYGVPPLSEAAMARIEAEWSGAAPRKRRRAA